MIIYKCTILGKIISRFFCNEVFNLLGKSHEHFYIISKTLKVVIRDYKINLIKLMTGVTLTFFNSCVAYTPLRWTGVDMSCITCHLEQYLLLKAGNPLIKKNHIVIIQYENEENKFLS